MNHLNHARSLTPPPIRPDAIAPSRDDLRRDAETPTKGALRQQHQVRRIDPCRDQQQREHQHGEC